MIFHDESTFNANDDQTLQSGIKGEGMLRPKSKRSGIMVSDFIDERNGYLRLTDEEFEQANAKDITINQCARETLEYGERVIVVVINSCSKLKRQQRSLI